MSGGSYNESCTTGAGAAASNVLSVYGLPAEEPSSGGMTEVEDVEGVQPYRQRLRTISGGCSPIKFKWVSGVVA